MRNTGLGASLFLVAAGAILFWAVTADAEGIDLNLVGLILMVTGVVGLLLTLVLTTSTTASDDHTTIIER